MPVKIEQGVVGERKEMVQGALHGLCAALIRSSGRKSAPAGTFAALNTKATCTGDTTLAWHT